jgi:hypothetical protein
MTPSRLRPNCSKKTDFCRGRLLEHRDYHFAERFFIALTAAELTKLAFAVSRECPACDQQAGRCKPNAGLTRMEFCCKRPKREVLIAQ